MWHPRPDAEDESVRDLRRAMLAEEQGSPAHDLQGPLTPNLLRDRSELLHPDLGRLRDVAQPGGFRRLHFKQNAEVKTEYAEKSLVRSHLMQIVDPSHFRDSLMQVLEPSIGLSFLQDDDEIDEQGSESCNRQRVGSAHGTSSNLATAMIVLKCCFGAAVLIVPRGFLNAGIIAGPALLLVVYVFMIAVMLRLLKARKTRTDNPHYHDMGTVLGRFGPNLIKATLVFACSGFNCIWIVTCQTNIRMLLPDWGATARLWVWFPLVVPLTWIRRLRVFTYTNLLGVAACLTTYVYLFYYAVTSIIANGTQPVYAVNTRNYDWLLWLGTCSYVFELAYLVLPIYDAAEDKESVPKIVVGITFVVLMMYIIFGCVFYMAFGDGTAVLALLNLPEGSLAGVVFPILFSIVGMVTQPINFFMLFQAYESQTAWPENKTVRKWAKNVLRAIIVAWLYLITWLGGEQLQNFLGLVGGLFGTTVALTLPTIIHTATCRPTGLSRAWDYLSLIFSISITITASGQAIASWK